jgi:inorganic pyrophosphatase
LNHTTRHPWHGIAPQPEGKTELVHAVIEIPQGSKLKFEVDKTSGLLKLDRVLHGAVHYPANYGFIPQTYAGDNDPLDILVLCQIELPPLCLVEARIIGVMRMRDREETDDKLIAVAHSDVSLAHIQTLSDVPEYLLKEIRKFFEEYKKLEQRFNVVIEEMGDAAKALEIFYEAKEGYVKHWGSTIK